METTTNHIYDIHLFVCINQRELPRTGCGDLGSIDLHRQLKDGIKKRNLEAKIRINKSGCLDQCSKGPAMVLYPEGKWYFFVSVADIDNILDDIQRRL